MPYETRAVPNDGFEVINSETQEVKDHHETKEDADRQVRLLNKTEAEMNNGE